MVRPSFWFGPHVFTAYANKNPVSLFEFQADKRGKILKKIRLIDHKYKWAKSLCQIVRIRINLSMFYATKTMEQWGPNHEYVTLWRDITTFSSLTRDFSASTRLNLPISSTNVKEIFFRFNGINIDLHICIKIQCFRDISLGGRTLVTPVGIQDDLKDSIVRLNHNFQNAIESKCKWM